MEGGWECKEVYKVKDYKTFSGFLRAVKSALRAIEIDDDLSYIVKIHELSPDRRYEYYADKVSRGRRMVLLHQETRCVFPVEQLRVGGR